MSNVLQSQLAWSILAGPTSHHGNWIAATWTWLNTDRLTVVATALTFAAILWQAVETRIAVQDQTLMQSEAVRARLDQRGPKVSIAVTYTEQGMWWAAAPSSETDPVPPDTYFDLAKQGDQRFRAFSQLVLTNDGELGVDVSWAWPIIREADLWSKNSTRQYGHVDGKSKLALRIIADMTLTEWSANYPKDDPASRLAVANNAVEGTIEISDMLDEGITDTWTINMCGTPVSPTPTKGIWIHRGRNKARRLTAVSFHTRRTYWISRRLRQEVPQPRKRRMIPSVTRRSRRAPRTSDEGHE